jgi:hypothetical protein
LANLKSERFFRISTGPLFAGEVRDLDAEIQHYQGLATDTERGGWRRNWFNFAPAGSGPWMAGGMFGGYDIL